MIDASKFSTPQLNGVGCGFRFGVGKDECVTALREMADAIERGDILVQKVQTGAITVVDDYTMQGIFIEFVEREKYEGAK
jgi:hypothetical protein